MSMSRNFLFYLLRDSEIKLNYTYKVKDNLYLIQIPTLLATPSVYYQNKKYKIQDAHLSIFRSYDKKEKIPQFSISHITLAFKINDYTESQIKVRVYLDLGGQPQEVGGKNCTIKLITEAKKDIYLDLGEEIETALVETAIFNGQEIIENIYNNYTTLIKNNQKLIDEILQELNHSELSEKRFRPLSKLKAACIWSEKYRPSDSIRTYHISLKNLAAQELEAIQLKKARRKPNKVAEQPLSAAPLLPTPSSLSTEQVPITTESKWKKTDKTTETIKLGQKKLEEARKAMKTNLCFDTLYNFLKVISLQIEIEIPHSDNMEQIFSMTSEAKECRRKLERILSTAFYQYENGKNKSDEIKQFLQLPLPDLKKFIDEIDDFIFSQVVLVGLIKMRELEIFCQLLPHFHFLYLSSETALHDHNMLLEVAKITDNNALSCQFAQFLLSRGARTRIYDRFSNSPLMWAVMLKNVELANLLLKYRADPNSSRRELGFRRDNTAYVYFLKDKGYENKPALYDLQTPLLVACLHRDEPMIEVLLNYGADPKQLSADGFDALGYYCYYMPNMAEHPLYASIKKQYQFYDTLSSSIPVHRQAAQKDTAEKLIARGCDVNAYQGKGKNKATPLSLAIQNGGEDETNLLLRLNAKFSLIDNAIIEGAKQTKARSLNSQNSGSQFFPACAQNAQDIPEGRLNRPINH